MDLRNSFEVPAGRAEAWAVLNDVERIAPCLPGAQLQEIEGDEFRGVVKIKVGPVTAQYKGKAVFVERDEDAGRVVLKADGRDTRGAGNANAVITATLATVSDEVTRVNVHTDLAITGKVAQFGRGVMADVSEKLMGQFADNLQTLIAESGDSASGAAALNGVGIAGAASASIVSDGAVSDNAASGSADCDEAGSDGVASDGAGANASADTPADAVRRIDSPEPEAVDLLDAAGASVFKRLLPVIGSALLLLILRRLLRSRS